MLYDYQQSRNGNNGLKYLKGYLHTDGFSGYNKLSGITRCGCCAVEAIPQQKAGNAPRIDSEIGRDYYDQLFHIESSLKDLSLTERYSKRDYSKTL